MEAKGLLGDFGQVCLQTRLDGILARLDLPPGELASVVGDRQLEAHGQFISEFVGIGKDVSHEGEMNPEPWTWLGSGMGKKEAARYRAASDLIFQTLISGGWESGVAVALVALVVTFVVTLVVTFVVTFVVVLAITATGVSAAWSPAAVTTGTRSAAVMAEAGGEFLK